MTVSQSLHMEAYRLMSSTTTHHTHTHTHTHNTHTHARTHTHTHTPQQCQINILLIQVTFRICVTLAIWLGLLVAKPIMGYTLKMVAHRWGLLVGLAVEGWGTR